MPNRSRKKKPTDLNQLARAIVEEATAEDAPQGAEDEPADETPPEPEKDPAAVALGRRGGLKGGKARAAKMTPEERAESARKAAAARWGTKQPM